MPAPDPSQMEQFLETANLKQMSDDGTAFRRVLNDMLVESLKAHQTVMAALTASVASNQDLRDKFALRWLETGPVEAASVATILQQAIKAAQSTPPETA